MVRDGPPRAFQIPRDSHLFLFLPLSFTFPQIDQNIRIPVSGELIRVSRRCCSLYILSVLRTRLRLQYLGTIGRSDDPNSPYWFATVM
jgi:hypothetical protein